MTENYFPFVEKVNYNNANLDNPFSYQFYDRDRMVLGKTMSDHLRISVCFWHTFCWDGKDNFGGRVFDRPWFNSTKDTVKAKIDAAFEFVSKLNVPFFSFHDEDIVPLREDINSFFYDLDKASEYIHKRMQSNNIGLLLGTANLFSEPCFSSGASTNTDPEVFTYAAAKVKHMLEITNRLDGQNYVLWGGREGYNTLLNTDLKREIDQLGRFVSLVVDHKHKIGFKGSLLIEPKPCEPSKHQYDYDVATVYGFLKKFGLEKEIKVNIEANHATLANHSFEHEVAYACCLGILGSIDANRGDPQNGWDTDQFPMSVEELTLIMSRLIENGGFENGGFNFDAKLRRQSIDIQDMFYAHIGGIDALAKSLLNAEKILKDNFLANIRNERYKDWDNQLGHSILANKYTLEQLSDIVTDRNVKPRQRSENQEFYEKKLNSYLWT